MLPAIAGPSERSGQDAESRRRGIDVGRWSWYALVAAVALSPLSSIRVTGAITYSDLLLVLAAGLWIFAFAMGKARLWLKPALLGAGLLFVLAWLLQHHDEGGLRQDTVYMLTVLMSMIFVPLVIANMPGASWQRLTWLIYVWLAFITIGSIVAILQSRGYSLGPFDRWLVRLGPRFAGFTLHPNTLAVSGALAVPGCFLLSLTARSMPAFAFWGLCTALNLWAINLSGSRAGLIAPLLPMLGAAGLYLLVQGASQRALARAAAAALVVILAAAVNPSAGAGLGKRETALQRLFGESAEALKSNSIRRDLRIFSIYRFETRPIAGNGYRWILAGHRQVVGLLEASGLIGFGGFLLQQLVVLWATVVALRRHREDAVKFCLALSMAAAWLTYTACGIEGVLILERFAHVPMGVLLLMARPVMMTAAVPAAVPESDMPALRLTPRGA